MTRLIRLILYFNDEYRYHITHYTYVQILKYAKVISLRIEDFGFFSKGNMLVYIVQIQYV